MTDHEGVSPQVRAARARAAQIAARVLSGSISPVLGAIELHQLRAWTLEFAGDAFHNVVTRFGSAASNEPLQPTSGDQVGIE